MLMRNMETQQGLNRIEEPSERIAVGLQIAPQFEKEIDTTHVLGVVWRTLAQEPLPAEMLELGLVIGDDAEIQDLNRQYRGIDAPTDVLSFAMTESGSDHPFVLPAGMPLYLGDVIVSYPRAIEQARAAGHSVAEELDLLIVHGVLHLLGYDHDTNDRKKAMWNRQETIIGKHLAE